MNPEKEKWVLLVLLSVIWGSSFILIKKSLEHFNPYEVGALRVLIAGIILLPLAILNIRKFPKKNLKWLILAAVTGNFIPMFLFPIAETEVSSSTAGQVAACRPASRTSSTASFNARSAFSKVVSPSGWSARR